MNLSFGKKRHYSLAGNGKNIVLAEIDKATTAEVVNLKLLAATACGIDDESALPRLLSTVAGTRGEISVVLPLGSFQVFTISLPPMPEGAVARALPYHISKVIDRPLSDFVFDWQLTGTRGNQLDITVYLLPRAFYDHLRGELARKQLEVTFLEADVFAAFAYLERAKNLRTDEATLCVLIWPQGVSLAIHENRVLSLVRDLNIACPANPYSSQPSVDVEASAEPRDLPETGREPESCDSGGNQAAIDFFLEEENNTDILAGFDVRTVNETMAKPAESTPPKNPFEAPEQVSGPRAIGTQTWPEYLQKISLEIMRTRDYHATVLKGRPLASIYVAGAEECWDAVADMVKSNLGVQIKPLTSRVADENCPAILSVILQGAGTRW